MSGLRVALFFVVILGLGLTAALLDYYHPAPGKADAGSAGKGPSDYTNLMQLSLPTPAGESIPLARYRDKLLVVNFWATWCGPCREEMPMLSRFRQEHAAKGVEIVGIAIDQPTKVLGFLAQTPVSYPILAEPTAALDLSRKLGNHLGVLPHTVIYSPSGQRVLAKIGTLSESELLAIVAEHQPKAR